MIGSRDPEQRLPDFESVRTSLREFGEFCVSSGYLQDVARVTGGAQAAVLRSRARALSATSLPEDLPLERRLCLEVLLLGREVAADAFRRALDRHLEVLLTTGVVQQHEGKVRSDRYLVAGLKERPFVVSRLRHERSQPGSIAAYLGRDTEELFERLLEVDCRNVLDLGCGAGIVGILSLVARPGCTVTGVDLCPEAVAVARLNAAMNSVDYAALVGDLYEPVSHQQYDLVVADPPAVPVPDELRFPIYGSGGPRGWDLLARIVTGAPEVLAPGGRLIAITELHCAAGELDFHEWLSSWAVAQPGRQVRTEIRGSRLLPADYYSSLGANLHFLPGAPWDAGVAAENADRLRHFAGKSNLRFGHWAHIEVRLDPERPSTSELSWAVPRPTPACRPRRSAPVDELLETLDAQYSHSSEHFGPVLRHFLDQADGAKTLGSIADQIPGDCLPYLSDLTVALFELGLVKPDPPLHSR